MPAARLFFTGDLHLGCRGALSTGWGKRPFSTLADHDAAVPQWINGSVCTNDQLCILGDNAFSRNVIEQATMVRDLLNALTCKHVTFILGNHDNVNALRCLGIEPLLYETRNWLGHKFFSCHYPMLMWPDSHYGSINCYGHTHAAHEEEFDSLMPMRRQLDVGLDNAYRLLGEYRPFEAGEIIDLLKNRTGSFPAGARTIAKEV